MEKHAFYIIKDEFFVRFNDPFLKGNKEENRPHYYCFQDNTEGIYWVIPMSSRVEKYKKIIVKKKEQNKPCDILHICRLSSGIENVFLIQDMFPVTENYILRPYTIGENILTLTKDKDIKVVEKKALRIKNMIENGKRFIPYQVDAMKIKNELLSDALMGV
ncbi:MAG: hypothetical protein Q4D76_19310 [Oscillospiraceae bacterium]|nr:hypothetical protein [Oscillospiraceae bacterium]